MGKLNISTEDIVSYIRNTHGDEVTTKDLKLVSKELNISLATLNNRLASYKTGRGRYSLSPIEVVEKLEEDFALPAEVPGNLIPDVDELFVPFGNFKDIKSIIKSGVFCPIFVTGLSGNGKTHSVEQACAQLKRELIRVNVTIETDTDDLVGGFRLVNGDTVWHDGPVVEALKRGAVLLLDEVDLASNKIMCLQSLLEGKGVYLKKTNQYVKPTTGFTVVATANTKGKGDETGNFIGANILNEAFLERFAFTFEQDYPTPSVERKILSRYMADLDCYDEQTIDQLVTWAEIIRKTYDDGGVDSVITTRRLINVIKAMAIWSDIEKSIEVTTNRFDDDTKVVFTQLWQKLQEPDETETQDQSADDSVTPAL